MPAERGLDRFLPRTLLGRITLVLALGVLGAQGLGSWLWASQLRERARQDAAAAAQHIATSAAGTVRFFRDLPPRFRPILIEQLRTMGGTRFFVAVNAAPVVVQALAGQPLADEVVARVRTELRQALPGLDDDTQGLLGLKIAFAMPEGLAVSPDGQTVQDLPEAWVEATLLTRPRPAPLLVIQAQIAPDGWLYLASRMPDPYFLDNANPLTADLIALQAATLLTVLALTTLLVRNLTRPLERIARAASHFAQDIRTELLPDDLVHHGSAELRRTAAAFNDMQARIQQYVEDRTRLFASISHDLKTPITRLKLRTELLDDPQAQADFHEDLDELDIMVKGALQTVKDSDIHENLDEVRLDQLVERLTTTLIRSGADLTVEAAPVVVRAKPLALKRALGNLVDNALHYGERVHVGVSATATEALVTVRDHGPGVPAGALATLFEPYVRLEHGQQRYRAGSGLGLGIARQIVAGHGGELRLRNHPEGGLEARISLPLASLQR